MKVFCFSLMCKRVKLNEKHAIRNNLWDTQGLTLPVLCDSGSLMKIKILNNENKNFK